MAFEWKRFLDDYSIPYVEHGPNINRNQIGIKCPYCGEADPSEHMALHRTAGWWRCRRNRLHGGDTPHRLVQLLAKCSLGHAVQIVGDQAPARDPDDDFADQIKALVAGPKTVTTDEPKPLKFPPEFKRLQMMGTGRLYWNYLRQRHYTNSQIDELIRYYDLHYATSGPYAMRVIIPVWTKVGLMSWTGRTIGTRDPVRYKSHSGNDYFPNDPPSFWNIHDLLLNEDDLDKGGDVLVVAEGPFDAMRLDFFGYPQVRATCFFGKSISQRQAFKLINLGRRYHRKWVLLDEDAKMDALAVQRQLEAGGFQIKFMEGGKDAAALFEPDIKRLIATL